mgnify:CR=1 FL=1
MRDLVKIIILSLYTLPAILIRVFNFRLINVNHKRIGHLCCDVFCLIQDSKINNLSFKYILLADKKTVANNYVLNYIKQYVFVIDNSFLCKFMFPLTKHRLSLKDVNEYSVDLNKGLFIKYIRYFENSKTPFFKISDEDISLGKKKLKQLGIPENAWYVCIHSRDSLYSGGKEKDYGQAFRNLDINDYKLAIQEIVSRGGYCIRMGAKSKNSIKIDGLIDYANHELKSEFMDVFLSANSKFYLCNSSGLYCLGTLFGNVPAACTNVAPLGASLVWSKRELSIPKLYSKNGKLLRFKDVFNKSCANYRTDNEFTESNIVLINNSKQEIRDLVIEMFQRIEDKNFKYSNEDELLQIRYKSLMNSSNYSFGGTSRIGRSFLKKYKYLIN